MTETTQRSMSQQSASLVTASNDHRVTRVGRFLRATKLDELPELLNVVLGDLSLVGPRPEVAKYVDLNDPLWQTLLTVRPGLTNETTLLLRNEEAILGLGAETTDLTAEQFYLQHLLPFKLRHSLDAGLQRSWWTDIKVLLRTAGAIAGLGGQVKPSDVVRAVLS